MLTANKSSGQSVSLHIAYFKILPNYFHSITFVQTLMTTSFFFAHKKITCSSFILLELLLVLQGYLRYLLISFSSLILFSSHQIEATSFHFQGFVLPTSALPLLPLFLIYSSRTDSTY